ncbi:MAG: YfhD-like protein [Paenibacillaceae bacterium]|nr:YfhD-like protein [Paenibacillaceae bacterium]
MENNENAADAINAMNAAIAKNDACNDACQTEQSNLPIGKDEDVEFSAELADEDDFEAAERAAEADNRQDGNQE